FLFIGSRLCSTLLSDPASRPRPCASRSLHLHQVVKRTFTSQLSNMLGTRKSGTQIVCRYFSQSAATGSAHRSALPQQPESQPRPPHDRPVPYAEGAHLGPSGRTRESCSSPCG